MSAAGGYNLNAHIDAARQAYLSNLPNLDVGWGKIHSMFQSGMSTLQIARVLNCHESQIVQQIDLARSIKLGLPSPYSPSEAV